ncbi:hypothetical protein HOF56_02645 [Candidatus Peribacteria bacterium]|jgi:hypothetical protein|nr:hypothetical protein [Candidatus Peribacteria bacterium]MBT4020937.1 hypothetical protein [Candidatus Peribacteria bacterium]MBT4240287.1 hypothetical protein [Candidatus Peribacteria bacterium]MBT4473902.1 hypothetical protein [Candidatus Peribacteria bacterium]
MSEKLQIEVAENTKMKSRPDQPNYGFGEQLAGILGYGHNTHNEVKTDFGEPHIGGFRDIEDK